MVMGSPMSVYEFLHQQLDLHQHGLLYADDTLFAGDDDLCLVTADTNHHGSQCASAHSPLPDLLNMNLGKAFDALNRDALINLKSEQRLSSKMDAETATAPSTQATTAPSRTSSTST